MAKILGSFGCLDHNLVLANILNKTADFHLTNTFVHIDWLVFGLLPIFKVYRKKVMQQKN